jgi:hypothetical protein
VQPAAICRLAGGGLADWPGLGWLDHTTPLPCVRSHVGRATVRFQPFLLAVDTYTIDPGAELRLYWAINEGTVELVEVAPGSGGDPARVRRELGEPATTHVYSLGDRAAAGLAAPPGGSVEEAVYDRRGLAVAAVRDATGAASVVRIRGFRPMPASEYLDAFVHFEPEPLE